MAAETSENSGLRLDGDVRDCSADDSTGTSSHASSWLYQCMIAECSAAFQRLADLRMHFIDVHQSGTGALATSGSRQPLANVNPTNHTIQPLTAAL